MRTVERRTGKRWLTGAARSPLHRLRDEPAAVAAATVGLPGEAGVVPTATGSVGVPTATGSVGAAACLTVGWSTSSSPPAVPLPDGGSLIRWPQPERRCPPIARR
jgi:hypothetical protein